MGVKKLISVFSFMAITFMAGCSDPVDIEYTVTKDESLRNVKRTVEVLLPERVDESILKDLANEIHKDGYERTFIGYRIKGEDEDGIYWATSNYNPDLQVTVLGSKKADHQRAKETSVVVDGNMIGTWLVNWGYEYKAAIYEREGKIMIKTVYGDGSQNDSPLIKVMVDGQARYFDEGGEERGEYFVINDKGMLEFWSKNGNYYTAPKR